MTNICYSDENKYLKNSSLVSSLPVIYSYLYKNYFLSKLYLITLATSYYYWSNPTPNKRILDIVVQTTIITYSFYIGNIHTNHRISTYVGDTLMFISLYCFYRSTIEYISENRNWYQYHIFFHIFGTLACLCCVNTQII